MYFLTDKIQLAVQTLQPENNVFIYSILLLKVLREKNTFRNFRSSESNGGAFFALGLGAAACGRLRLVMQFSPLCSQFSVFCYIHLVSPP